MINSAKPDLPGTWERTDHPEPKGRRSQEWPGIWASDQGCLAIPARRRAWAWSLIDAQDAWALSRNWYHTPEFYVFCNVSRRCRYLHRAIMWCMKHDAAEPAPEWWLNADTPVDHINRNRLDNRRSNLRLVSISLNNANQHHKRDLPPGVYWDDSRDRFLVHLKWQGVDHYAGRHKTLHAATRAADALRKRLHKPSRDLFSLNEVAF